jgi:hypothetical protein
LVERGGIAGFAQRAKPGEVVIAALAEESGFRARGKIPAEPCG